MLPKGVSTGFTAYLYPWIPMQGAKLVALCGSLIDAKFGYEMGAKMAPLDRQAFDVPLGEREIDCSGFTRWAVSHATNGVCVLPDGSVNQREWCKQVGFKQTTPDAGLSKDGAIRIAFLTPDGAERAGLSREERHVMLVIGGQTLESHGGKGPDFRDWLSKPWMHMTELYVLTPPTRILAAM